MSSEEECMIVTVSGETRNPIGSVALLDSVIAVGLGQATIERDGRVVVDCETEMWADNQWTFADAERLAAEDAYGCWRVVMNAPLWNATWERRGPSEWICVAAGLGFA